MFKSLWPRTIRAQLRLGFSAILLLSCISSAIGYGSLQRLRSTSQNSLESAARIRELSLELQVNFLQARKAERTYLQQWRTASFAEKSEEYIKTNYAYLNKAQVELAALREMSSNPELLNEFNLLEALFENYASAFEATTQRISQEGSGYQLYEDLQTTLSALAEEVTLLENSRVQLLMWDLVIKGQAFFNTGEQQYANEVRASLDRLTSEITTSDTYSQDAPLDLLSQDYITTLNELLMLNQQIRVNGIISENINQEINRLIARISQVSEAQAAEARLELDRTATQTSLALLLTSTTALGLTIWASLWLVSRMMRPLTVLSRTAENVAQGDLDQTMPVTGRDEFSTVAAVFNQMMAQLRLMMGTLEQQVSDRTRALADANQALQDQTHSLEQALQKLQRSETEYRQLIQNLHAGVLVYNAEGQIILGNQTAWDLLGTTRLELVQPHSLGLVDEAGQRLLPEQHPAQQVIASRSPLQNQVMGIRHSAEQNWIWLLVSAFPTFDAGDSRETLSQVVVTFIDISDRKLAEEELRYQALHDALTGLPNRVLFARHLDYALQRLKRHPDHQFAVLFIDLDRFKVINDSLGHLIGDQLLIQMAAILKRHVRTSDVVARLGGDEFVILLEQIADTKEVIQVAERIQADARQPVELSNHTVFTSASIGIALSNPEYTTGEDILRNADNAMYWAKSQGKARHAVFTPEMHKSALQLFEQETSLRRALEKQEFILYYQPIVSLDAHRLLGLEALVRWMHPERGLLLPKDFIRFAEEARLIATLSDWILQTACCQMMQWRQNLPAAENLKISVNIAADQFREANFLETLDQTLAKTKLPASSLQLELAESLLLENVDRALSTLISLQTRDIEISIDDFGTGYSSMSYLKQLPINSLKIDRSFIQDLEHENQDASIVEAIIQIAQLLKKSVIAEGVETRFQHNRLQRLGCDAMQGYLIAPPLPPAEAADFIQTHLNVQNNLRD